MPGPTDRPSSPAVASDGGGRASTRSGAIESTGSRRAEGRSRERKHTDHIDREPASSRSISPSAPFSAESEQSTSSPASPTFTSLPAFPPSPERTQKHNRETSRSFFQNLKASKSSAKIQQPDTTIRYVPVDEASEDPPRSMSKTTSTPDLRGTSQTDPVPDLPRLDKDEASQRSVTSSASSHTIPRRPVGSAPTSSSKSQQSQSDSSLQNPYHDTHEPKKNGKLFPSFMKRHHGENFKDSTHGSKPGTPVFPKSYDTSMKPPSRDRSASRHTDDDETYSHSHSHERKASKTQQLRDQRSQSFRDGMGTKLATGFKAAKDIGKAGKGFFKGRHASAPQAPPDYMSYHVKIINLPLVDQTRLTRIAKRLEDSKDKTEFWMPALPWRCIDYLNYTGCETEGLYRVPGAEREVKMWKYRFDTEHDINLFEQEDLFDINAIGSLFKSWLRELPDDVFPQDLQEALSAKYAGHEKAPEEVKEVLSALPPWNYYLLFAITCHLSLLNAYQDKNKMTFHNLFICFANSLRLNSDCFRWLVADWRSCWKGCITEKGALEAEYGLMETYVDTFDSDTSSQDTRINEQQSPIETNDEATPRAETFLASQNSGQQRPASAPKSRKESPAPINAAALYANSQSSPRSQENTRNMASPEGYEDNHQNEKHVIASGPSTPGPETPGHQRNNSKLPEFDFGKPISPTFATRKRDSAATFKQT